MKKQTKSNIIGIIILVIAISIGIYGFIGTIYPEQLELNLYIFLVGAVSMIIIACFGKFMGLDRWSSDNESR